jgi:thioredoxin 1
MAGDKVKSISDSTFETEIMQSDVPALVDFWAPWCGPCKAISPMLEELAGEFDGRIKMTKMNVDDNPATPGKYGIRAIPTLILFKDGQIVDQITGAVGKSQMVTMLNKAL